MTTTLTGEVTEKSVPAASDPGPSMDLLSIWRLLLRRWWVTVPALTLTMLGVFAAFALSPPTYRSSGSIVLLNPPSPPDPNSLPPSSPVVNTENPYARFNDLSVMVDIVARVMKTDAEKALMLDRGVRKFEVAANTNFSSGPLIEVTADESTQEAAIASARAVLAEVQRVLEERQLSQGTDPRYLISFDTIEAPSRTTTVLASTVRLAMAALAIGSLFTLGLAMLAESIALRGARATEPASGHGSTNGSTNKGGAAKATPPRRSTATAKRRPRTRVATSSS